MERDPSFKQLIPYVIFRYRHPQSGQSLFCYTRGSGQGEARLHRKRSIGVGGHISIHDASELAHGNVYAEGMRRELDEEVEIRTPYQPRCVGLINDDETEVGTVHLGVVHLCDVETPAVTAREADILDARFLPLAQLLGHLDEFESWSRICLEGLFA
jgi:predicted NUDIX family phosphoesterase